MKNWIIFFGAITLLISCNVKEKQLVKIEGDLLPVHKDLQDNQAVEQIIAPYREKIDGEMKTKISYTPKRLTKSDSRHESTLGNLMADMCYIKANPVFEKRTGNTIDFSLFNHGGIRTSIDKGPITQEDVFKLMPFENMLIVVEISYENLLKMVDYLRRANSAHPLSQQVRLNISKNDFSMTIRGKKITSERNYYILTTDYLQKGGDNMNFLKDPVAIHTLDYKMRNAMIDYFKETDTVSPVLDGRLTINE